MSHLSPGRFSYHVNASGNVSVDDAPACVAITARSIEQGEIKLDDLGTRLPISVHQGVVTVFDHYGRAFNYAVQYPILTPIEDGLQLVYICEFQTKSAPLPRMTAAEKAAERAADIQRNTAGANTGDGVEFVDSSKLSETIGFNISALEAAIRSEDEAAKMFSSADIGNVSISEAKTGDFTVGWAPIHDDYFADHIDRMRQVEEEQIEVEEGDEHEPEFVSVNYGDDEIHFDDIVDGGEDEDGRLWFIDSQGEIFVPKSGWLFWSARVE